MLAGFFPLRLALKHITRISMVSSLPKQGNELCLQVCLGWVKHKRTTLLSVVARVNFFFLGRKSNQASRA